MPIVANIVNVSPPPAPPANDFSSSSDGSTTRFDDALDQAQRDSGKAKLIFSYEINRWLAPRRARAQDHERREGGQTYESQNDSEEEEPQDSDRVEDDHAGSTAPEAKLPDDPADAPSAAKTAGGPKPKTAKTEQSADEAQNPSLAQAEQGIQLVKPVDPDGRKSSQQPDEQSDKSKASVQALQERGASGTAQNPDASVDNAATRHAISSAHQQSQQPAGLKLGGGISAHSGKAHAGGSSAGNASASSDTGAEADADAVDSATPQDPASAALATATIGGGSQAEASSGSRAEHRVFSEVLATAQGQAPAETKSAPTNDPAIAKVPPVPPEVRFADANQATIVSSVHTQLLPNGGSMQIRLDPPDLGTMSVSVHMKDGVMTATFETSNDQASRLLTHNLGQLKTALESQGVSVGRLHVEQAPKDSQSNARDGGKNGDGSGSEQSAHQQQQEQQRREMLRQMWRRLSGVKDPLDLVA